MFIGEIAEFNVGEKLINLSANIDRKVKKRRDKEHDYVGNPYIMARANTGKWLAGGAGLGLLGYANTKRSLIKTANKNRSKVGMKPVTTGEIIKSLPGDVPYALTKKILPAAVAAVSLGGAYNLGKYYYNKNKKNKKNK